jgi:hypothetical protein
MNKPAARLSNTFESIDNAEPAVNASINIRVFLKTLSLNAPKNCVKNSGRNRVDLNNFD